MHTRCLTVALIVLSIGNATALEPAEADPKFVSRVTGLVRQLGDENFDRRQAAQKQLVAFGPAALPILDRLEPFADPEVEHRVRAVRRAVGGPVEELREALAIYARLNPNHEREFDPATLKLVGDHQPATGDFLLALIADPKQPLRRTALKTLVGAWNAMTPGQVRTHIEKSVQFVVHQRSAYPRGVDAQLGMGNNTRDGWNGVPRPDLLKMSTVTVHTLDGKPYGEPFAYAALGCTTGWIKTKDLALGRHAVSAAVKFEFAHAGKTVAGSVQSPQYTFEMLPANTPDDLAAPGDAAVEKMIRAFKFSETAEPAEAPNQLRQNFRGQGGIPVAVDWWRPQTTWVGKDGKPNGLHLPCWKQDKALPVDLAFAVSVRIVASGEEFPAGTLVSIKGEADYSAWNFYLKDVVAVTKGLSGFVPVKIVLKPSRAAALTNLRVTKYFTGEVVSEPLRMKVGPAATPAADPFVLPLK